MQPPIRIISCAEWGAAPARKVFPVTRPTLVVWHHMAWPNRPLLLDQRAIDHAKVVAEQCQLDHQRGNGWSDTGQHFTITREGIVLEGRHGSLAAALAGQCIRGAHAADPDTGADANDSWGIEHEGTYTAVDMPRAQWEASIALTAWLCVQCDIDSSQVVGHRDTGCATACPGDRLHAQLARARREVHEQKLMLLGHA